MRPQESEATGSGHWRPQPGWRWVGDGDWEADRKYRLGMGWEVAGSWAGECVRLPDRHFHGCQDNGLVA